MTKEQEVIKYIETRIKICNENADICDDNDFDEEATYLREESYMLETVLNMLKEKDVLYPSRLNQHRLYLKNESGKELGYLSFFDDRLYYIIIPLFEQRRVLVKIRAASPDCGKGKKKTSGYYRLHLWLKMPGDNPITSLENLNLQIEQLLTAYR